jgi:multimeric flavodoxin WrbA
MRVVSVLGSHRNDSNSSQVAEGIVKGLNLQETDEQVLVALNRCKILPCLACDSCSDGDCIIKDDFEMIMEEIRKADLVIFATPVYFNGVSSIMKTFIDRAQQYFSDSKDFSQASRDVILVATGGASEYEDQFEGVRLNFKYFIEYVNGKLWSFVKVPGTDHASVSEREELQKSLWETGRQWREIHNQKR